MARGETQPKATQSRHGDATTFIVGAGASFEFGLPIGSGLVDRIRNFLSPTLAEQGELRARQSLFESLARSEVATSRELEDAGRMLFDGLHLSSSIDAFLHAQQDTPGVVPLGKALVTQMILRAEGRSKLLHRERKRGHARALDWEALTNTWAAKFFPLLVEGCRPEDVRERLSRCSFVVFNYDRCLEEFLRTAFRMTSFAQDDAEAEALVQSLRIVHPYGTVGVLEQDHPNYTPFGADLSPSRMVQCSGSIRTFAEGTESREIIQTVHDYLRHARRVVFLGFGFLPINLRLLDQPNDDGLAAQSVWATAYEVSEEDAKHVQGQVGQVLPATFNNVRIGPPDETCAKFFENLSRTLGFEWSSS